MKAVAADAGVRIFAGNGERLSNRRLAAMESGVETGDLRQTRMRLADRPNCREIMRLMQRRERDERRKLLDDLIRQQQWRRIFSTAMNDTVPNSRNIPPVKPLCADPHHRLSCCGMVEACVFEAFLNKQLAFRDQTISPLALRRCPRSGLAGAARESRLPEIRRI